METIEAAWVARVEEGLAQLDKQKNEDRERLDKLTKEVQVLRRLHFGVNVDSHDYAHPEFSDGQGVDLQFFDDGTYHAEMYKGCSRRDGPFPSRYRTALVLSAGTTMRILDAGDRSVIVDSVPLGSSDEPVTFEDMVHALSKALTGQLGENIAGSLAEMRLPACAGSPVTFEIEIYWSPRTKRSPI